jgi:uncharacterized tellurite resistance protein B-like protein
MIADEQDRDTKASQLISEVVAQGVVAHLVTADPDIVNEETDKRVEIASVEGYGIATCELADLLMC